LLGLNKQQQINSPSRWPWRNDYVTKLREDQIAAKAEHAILSSRVFPAGNRTTG